MMSNSFQNTSKIKACYNIKLIYFNYCNINILNL